MIESEKKARTTEKKGKKTRFFMSADSIDYQGVRAQKSSFMRLIMVF